MVVYVFKPIRMNAIPETDRDKHSKELSTAAMTILLIIETVSSIPGDRIFCGIPGHGNPDSTFNTTDRNISQATFETAFETDQFILYHRDHHLDSHIFDPQTLDTVHPSATLTA